MISPNKFKVPAFYSEFSKKYYINFSVYKSFYTIRSLEDQLQTIVKITKPTNSIRLKHKKHSNSDMTGTDYKVIKTHPENLKITYKEHSEYLHQFLPDLRRVLNSMGSNILQRDPEIYNNLKNIIKSWEIILEIRTSFPFQKSKS